VKNKTMPPASASDKDATKIQKDGKKDIKKEIKAPLPPPPTPQQGKLYFYPLHTIQV
jgi:hypothetical protein